MSGERWTQAGDKMRFLGKNGYDHERAEAMKVFAPGEIVTVERCSVSSWRHSVWFEEYPGKGWNGVMFERLSASPAIDGGDSSSSQSQPCGEASADAEVFAGLEAVRSALARITQVDAECPVRSGRYKGVKVPTSGPCRRCGATDRDSCGPNVGALVALEEAARKALGGAS